MKKVYLILVGLLTMGVFAQAQESDTVVITKRTKRVVVNSDGVNVTIDTKSSDTVYKSPSSRYPKLTFGLTFEHFDIGFSKYHAGSDFGTPVGYRDLRTDRWKTSNIGFDFLQTALRFNPNFKIMLAAGLDWNHMRLNRDVTILADQPTLTIMRDAIHYEKNRFSSQYLRVPLYFEYRSPQNRQSKRASIVFGPEVGFLLNGKVKQISKENGKQKFKDDYNLEPFRYGANIRIGYGGAGLFFKYYLNDVFAKNEGPTDYKNLNFGLTFGF